MDTSALVAALIPSHEYHDLARPRLPGDAALPAIVLAETYAQFRRTFGQPAARAVGLLAPWTGSADRVLGTTGSAVVTVFGRAHELDLGGNIHDALIAQVCLEAGVELVTLDRRQHRVALSIGARSRYLLG